MQIITEWWRSTAAVRCPSIWSARTSRPHVLSCHVISCPHPRTGTRITYETQVIWKDFVKHQIAAKSRLIQRIKSHDVLTVRVCVLKSHQRIVVTMSQHWTSNLSLDSVANYVCWTHSVSKSSKFCSSAYLTHSKSSKKWIADPYIYIPLEKQKLDAQLTEGPSDPRTVRETAWGNMTSPLSDRVDP